VPAAAAPAAEAGRGGALAAFGIANLEQEVAKHPERFRPIEVDLGDIVGSPYNPAHRLEPNEEELADILPSVREVGVLSPVLVCERAVLITNSPQLDEVTDDGELVLLAGHRRTAASKLAGRTTISVIVRNDFANARALTVIRLVENGGRLALTPIEEAEGYQLLVAEGMSYQQIVDTVGGTVRSKGQVAKRIKLLQLTDLGKDLLSRREITVDGALTLLAKLPDSPVSQDRVLIAATTGELDERISLKAAVEQECRHINQQAAATAAREQAAAMGLREIDPRDRWGDNDWQYRLTTEDEIAAAKAAGDLAGVVVVDGRLAYYRASAPVPDASSVPEPRAAEQPPQAAVEQTPPTRTPAPARTRDTKTDVTPEDPAAARAAQERRQAHHDASAARKDACRRMVNEFSAFRDSHRPALIEILADAVLAGGTDKAVLRRPEVTEWTGSSVATEYDLGEVVLQDRPEATRLAFATALATMEAQAVDERYLSNRPWPPAVQRHIHRLVELGYHDLTPYEQDKLG